MIVSYIYFTLLGFLFVLSGYEIFSGYDEKLGNKLFWFSAVMLILLCGFRPLTFDRDIQMYFQGFNEFCRYSLRDLLIDNPHRIREKGFLIVNKLFCNIGFRQLLLFFAVLGIGIKALVISKKSQLQHTALFLYAVFFFPLREFTQVRDAVASSFVILALLYSKKETLFWSVLLFLIGLSFHMVSLIYIPIIVILYIVKKQWIYFLLIPLGVIMFFVRPTDWLKNTDQLPNQILKYNDIVGTGGLIIVFFVAFVIFLHHRKQNDINIQQTNEINLYIKLSYLCIFIGLATYHHPVLSRLSNLLVIFCILLLTNLIPHYVSRKRRYYFIIVLLIFYIIGIKNYLLVTDVMI